jgi:hypothetical protein
LLWRAAARQIDVASIERGFPQGKTS